MSKITFDDNSFIEIKKSNEPGKVLIIIQARDHLNNLKKITNCIEITDEQFKELVSNI